MGWWSSLWIQRASQWTFEPLRANQVPDELAHQVVEPNLRYLSIFLRSLRVTDVRRGLNKFYGTVHSFISIPHLSGQTAEFNVLTTPTDLSNIDAANVDRIITRTRRLLGPIPYRGGDVQVELGLFSIKSVDLAGPYLQVLEDMATAAGVSYVNTALLFAGPIIKGINLLTGSAADTDLEIGLSTTLDRPETGYFVLMRAQKGTVPISRFRLDQDHSLLDDSGKPVLDYPYMVFSVEASEKRDDWFQIPGLAEARNKLNEVVLTGNIEEAKNAFAVFKNQILTSPDMLTKHAQKVADEIESDMKNILGPTRTSTANGQELRRLEEINPFD